MLSVDMKYGSALHERVKNAVKERRDFSHRKMKNFHKQWDDADDSMRAYIKERTKDKERKDRKTYDGEVDYVTLEIPYVYAIIMTAHTYYSSVILGRTPIWQFTGRHGESQDSVQAVEAVMDYQTKNGGMVPVMYHWLYDMARYSLGIVGTYWDEEERIICQYVDEPRTIMGVQFGGTRRVKKEEIIKGYIGNKLYNVRPYDFYPDPRLPIWKFQQGEFCGRDTSLGYFEMIAEEHSAPGTYINLDALAQKLKEARQDRNEGSSRVELPVEPGAENPPGPGFFKVHEMYVKLVPSTWGLGTSKRVEIWCFKVANDEIVIQAQPLGLYHNRFPFSVMEGNFGSDEFAKYGTLEIMRPMTDILTWLVNSHFYNVRRVLNNQIIVDPSKIVMKDLTKPGQRVIRLKPTAYNQDVRTAVHQLQMYDVTRTNLADAQYVEQMIQRTTAVVDTVMGMQDGSSRRSATESRITSGFSTSRLKTPVEYNSHLALGPLADMMLSNTQQFMDIERQFAVAGNTMQGANAFVDVNPMRIAGAYDFVPVDGTAPIDRLAQANFWKELLMQMSRVPQFAMEWDLGGMVAHTMKMQGERNVERFRRVNVNVLPPGVAPSPGAVPVTGAPPSGQSGPKGSSGGTV